MNEQLFKIKIIDLFVTMMLDDVGCTLKKKEKKEGLKGGGGGGLKEE